MRKNGYYWYYINVYEEEHKMHQEFADRDFKTKEQAISDAKERMDGIKRHHAELHIMHYDETDYNDFNENMIEI